MFEIEEVVRRWLRGQGVKPQVWRAFNKRKSFCATPSSGRGWSTEWRRPTRGSRRHSPEGERRPSPATLFDVPKLEVGVVLCQRLELLLGDVDSIVSEVSQLCEPQERRDVRDFRFTDVEGFEIL